MILNLLLWPFGPKGHGHLIAYLHEKIICDSENNANATYNIKTASNIVTL